MVECNSDSDIVVTIGLCAMGRKVTSKPMKEILRRMDKFQHIRVIIFDESMILNEPVESWPICDALVSFYSEGFPLKKAIEYSELRNPYLVNDLESQYILMDRKLVYECLKREGVPVPRSACVMRDGISPTPNVVETDDSIEIDGVVFHKPFVEKPINAEDHNVYIYFPSSAGGGSQRLFRKVGNLSSRYYSDSNIRKTGSYIYEEFLPTDGTDVKVYTVADDYAHAEARKSPALDGVVERDYEGKEVRYPVILSPREKNIAKKVANAVRQQICGFDLLRANGMSYVCDVNGFSFVKSSRKYYDDCSHILGVLITRKIAPRLCLPAYLPPGTDVDTPLVPTTCGTIMELRCVIAVIRHGDRTPKQKMKMEVRHDKFFALFSKYASGAWIHEVKLKRPTQLQEVLEIARCILYEMETGECDDPQLLENKSKFEQLRSVLEMYGSFSGINRKIQLKYYPHGLPKNTKLDPADTQSSSASGGSGTEDQPSLLLVVKWGGELTLAGRQQAENLGRAFRCIYPGGDGHYGKDPGLGLLRLHSTYRHDLKIYASDEGRVQMTAAAFAKGFLALEGELPPILVQMVKSANTNGLLDNDHDCRHYQNTVKHKLSEVMSKRQDFIMEDYTNLVPTGSLSMLEAMRYVNNPREACNRLFEHVRCLHDHLKQLMATSPQRRQAIQLYQGESWDLLLRRWGKLLRDFKPREADYDLTKISDIYDNIKYDLQHNPGILVASEQHDFFMCAKSLADIVVPQEYGITKEEKLAIGQRICTPLMRKILSDARYTGVDECTRLHAGHRPNHGPPCADCYSKGVASPERFVRSRLYFTSESHLHSLLTCLRYGGLADVTTDEQWRRAMDYVSSVSEINYLAQIVIMIYEDPSVEPKLEERYHVELHFSPGAYVLCHNMPERGAFRPGKLERLNSQTSVLSSCTSQGKCSTESLTQYSSRMSTHGSVTPITYAPPRQKGKSSHRQEQQHRTDCEACSASQEQQQKGQVAMSPDDQLVIVSKSPDPSSNISLLTDPGVNSSTSQSSLNDLTGANGIIAQSDTYVYPAFASGAPVERPDASPNHEPADLSKTLESDGKSPVKGLDNGEQQDQNQQHPDSTPEATLQCNSPRTGCRPQSMPSDAKVSADMVSSLSLTPAPPSSAQEVRATRSMPIASPSSNITSVATMTRATTVDERKVNIGRFLITRPLADQQQQQQDSLKQQHAMTAPLKSTGGTTGPEVVEAVPHSSTSSHTSTSMTLAPTRITLCHAGRQSTSCPPDPSHSADVEKANLTTSTTTGTGTSATTCDNSDCYSDDQSQSVTPISSGHSAARRLTPSTPTSPTRQNARVSRKPPKIAVKTPASGAKVFKSSERDRRLSQQRQQSGGQTSLDRLCREEACSVTWQLSLAQSQESPRKTYFHGNARTSRLQDAGVLTRTTEDEFQLAFHRMHQLMRRHSTGSLMLPHHQLVSQSTALHSAGVSAAGLPTEPLNQLFGFLVADTSLPPTPTGQVVPPPAPQVQWSADESGTGGQRLGPQKPRRRVVGRVRVEPPPPSSLARPEFVGESATELTYRRLELAGLTAGQRSPGSGLRAGVDSEEQQPLQDGQEEVGDAETDEELSTANYQALNALTFPSSFNPYHIDFNRLARSVAMGIPFPTPFCRSLISTAVIRGSRDDAQASSSVPDMKHLMEDSEQPPRTLTPGTSSDFPVPSAPSVPEVYPLETLHNALTLNQLETFFTKVTTHKFDTPFTSPQHPSTPISFCPAPTCSHGASSGGLCQYGSATSLPTIINGDEFLFLNSPPNQCDLLPLFSCEAQEQLQQQKLQQQQISQPGKQMLLPQQQQHTTTPGGATGGLPHVQSAFNMVTTAGSANIPSMKTAAQPSSSTTDGFAEVTSETATDCGCWVRPTSEME